MRFKADNIGCLVRPKTITHLFLWKNNDKDIGQWWAEIVSTFRWHDFEKKQQLIDFYKCSLDYLFRDLELGNPATNPDKSYIGEIVSFIILYKGSLYHISSKEKAIHFEKELIKRFGKNAFLPVVAVGLKFYKSFSRDQEEKLNEPWEYTNREDVTWFYKPKEIIPLENILSFEKLQTGDLISLKRVIGVVTSVKDLSKPKFYSANSCVSKSILLLTTNINYLRLTPDKRFKKH